MASGQNSGNGRSRLGADERRGQLGALGIKLFSTRPYDEISIREIAAAAGISKGLLYHYFPSKHDFYVETLRVVAQELLEASDPKPSAPPLERLTAGIDGYLDYVEQRSEVYALALQGGVGYDEEVGRVVQRARDQFVALVVGGADRADAHPALQTAVRGWLGFVEGACLNWLERRHLDRDEMRTLLIGALAGAVAQAQRIDPGIELGFAARPASADGARSGRS